MKLQSEQFEGDPFVFETVDVEGAFESPTFFIDGFEKVEFVFGYFVDWFELAISYFFFVGDYEADYVGDGWDYYGCCRVCIPHGNYTWFILFWWM